MKETKVRAALLLRRQRMPLPEIRAILSANDPVAVRHHLELHRERLEEWLAGQRAAIASLETALAGGIHRRQAGAAASQPTSEGKGEPPGIAARSASS